MMLLRMLACAMLSCAAAAASAQTLDWLSTIASDGVNSSQRVEADSDLNVISVGMAPGAVYLSPGGLYPNFAPGASLTYVYKLDPLRNLLWLARIEGGANNAALTVGRNDDVFIGSGAGSASFTEIIPAVGDSIVIYNDTTEAALLWKLGPDGSTAWLRQFASSGDATIREIAARPGGGVVAAGGFKGTIQLGSTQGSHTLTSIGGYDVFVVVLDTHGNLIWTQRLGGAADDLPTAVESSADGGVVLAGTFGAEFTVVGPEGPTVISSAGGLDGFLVQYEADGMLHYAGSIGGSGHDVIHDFDADPSGNTVIAGSFSDIADLDPGPATLDLASSGESDIFVGFLDDTGHVIWTKSYGGSGNDLANSVRLGSGKVYVGGTFSSSVDFSDSGSNVLVANGIEDGFVLRLSRNGEFERSFSYGGSSLIAGSDRVYDLTLDWLGALLVTGSYAEAVDFDPSGGTLIIDNNSSFADGYVWKLNDAGAFLASIGISPASLTFGQAAVVEVTLTSTLGVDLSGLTVDQVLPAALRLSTTPNAMTTCGGSVTALAGAAELSLADGYLATGDSCSVSVTVVASSVGESSLESMPSAFGNAQSIWPLTPVITTFEVEPAATVLQWIAHEPVVSVPGQMVTFGVDVESSGEVIAEASGTITLSNGEHSCEIDLPTSTCELAFDMIGAYEVAAEYSGDGNFRSAQSTYNHNVRASVDLSIAIFSAPAVWPLKTEVGFDLTVANTGPDDADVVNVSMPMAQFTSASWMCTSGCTASGEAGVHLTLPLDAGDTANVHVQARVANSADAFLTITAAATPSALVIDSDTVDNYASFTAPLALFRDGFD